MNPTIENIIGLALFVVIVGGMLVSAVWEYVENKHRSRKNRIAFQHWMAGHAAASPPYGEDSEKDYRGYRG